MDAVHDKCVDDEKPCILSLSAALKTYSENEICRENEQVGLSEKTEMVADFSFTGGDTSLANTNETVDEDEDFQDFYEAQNYTLICRISEKFHESIKNIMEYRAVGVAFEGQKLGRDGTLSLVQIATDSELIIFDIIRLGEEAFKAGLQNIFESEDVMKVIHDCRWIADLLRYQHEVSLANVFDTQVANAFAYRSLTGGKWPSIVESLPDCLKNRLNLPLQDVNIAQIMELNREENDILWLVRPLPSELLDTARKNTVYLLRLQRVLLGEMLMEFKAAVDIYLNCSSGTQEDMEKCRLTRHLLPIAFTHIHTYIKQKSDSRSQMDPLSPSSEEFETQPGFSGHNSTKALSKLSKVSSSTNRKKKAIPKEEKKTQQLSEKAKSYKEMGRDALPNEGSSSFQLKSDCGNTDIIGYNTYLGIDRTVELDYTILDSPNGESDNADSFVDEETGPNVDHVCLTSLNTEALPSVSVPRVVLQRVDKVNLMPEMKAEGKQSMPCISLAYIDSQKEQKTVSDGVKEDQSIEKTLIAPTSDLLKQEKHRFKGSSIPQLNSHNVHHQQLEELQAGSCVSHDLPTTATLQLLANPSAANKKDTQLIRQSLKADPANEGTVSASGSLLAAEIQATQAAVEVEKLKLSTESLTLNTASGDEHTGIGVYTQDKVVQFKVRAKTVICAGKEASSAALSIEHENHQNVICSKTFGSQRVLSLHKKMRPLLNLKRFYKCDLCNKNLTTLSSLKNHVIVFIVEREMRMMGKGRGKLGKLAQDQSGWLYLCVAYTLPRVKGIDDE
ncbi:exonuclease 3'-5' domain-containing protein 1 [Elysia marginata]|uniref:Exonuclease 3'-5' domain-containing protein 1 n=1 Tax=Elysia marginata TaxID=1093978 RepID=A0AAV4E9I2_9GAST|nr:exonuclease 3'-5' domain-containing protein 1 [Elysia marginata]